MERRKAPVRADRLAARFRDELRTGLRELTWINGGPGVVFRGPDHVVATLTFDFDPEGRISTIHNVANPDKLHAVADGTRHE